MPLNDARTLVDPLVAEHRALPVHTDDSDLVAGRYRLLRPLGEGGMGNVYLADDLFLTRRVAIKTIRPELSGNAEVRSRIRRECRMHAAIGVHPHIVTLYDSVEEKGHIYLVMEYFAGETLAERLAAEGGAGRIPLGRGLDIIRQVLAALGCIHGRDIVHRDIKTANILLQTQEDGRVLAKLTDFGIARAEAEPDAQTQLTMLGSQGPGTPVYMAPERIDPQTFGPITPAADLYAVGIILFELLTGRPPFNGSMTEIFSGHLVQPPALDLLPEGVPAALNAVLRTALAKKPSDRYADAAAFAQALEPIGAESGPALALLPARPALAPATLLASAEQAAAVAAGDATVLDPAMGRARRRPRRRLPLWQWCGAAVAVAVLAGLFLFYGSRPAGSPPASTPEQSAAAVPVPPPADPAVSPPVTTDAAPPTALETVDQARQQRSIESMATAERTTPGAVSQEWQIIEHQSRKIR